MCACLPTLRPLIQKIVPHLLSTRDDSGDTTNRLSSVGEKGDRVDPEVGIYVQKEIELHSTTELKANAAGCRPSIEDAASQKTAITAQSSKGQLRL